MKQIVFDRVFAEIEPFRNLTIAQPFGQATYHVLLALREQLRALGVDQARRYRIRQSLEHQAKLCAVRPDLA